MQRAELHPNRLTNAWVPFLVAATLLLNKTGRLAMVIPAELLSSQLRGGAIDVSSASTTATLRLSLSKNSSLMVSNKR